MADDTAALDALAALDCELDAGRVTLVDYWRRRAAIESGRAVPTHREPITAPAEDPRAEEPEPTPEPSTERELGPETPEPAAQPSTQRELGPETPAPAPTPAPAAPAPAALAPAAPAPAALEPPVSEMPVQGMPVERGPAADPHRTGVPPLSTPGPAAHQGAADELTAKPAPSYRLDDPAPPPAPAPAAPAAPPDRTAEGSGLRPAAHTPFAPPDGAVNIPFTPTWTPEPEPDPPWRRALRGTQSSRVPKRGKLPRRWGRR